MSRQVIVFTAYNRPAYLAETLHSWREVRGVENAIMDFHVEPSDKTTEINRVIIGHTRGIDMCIHQNDHVLGVQRNPYSAISCGFDDHRLHKRFGYPDDFVILAEDDFVVGKGILEYFAWAQREYYEDPRVLAVSATQFEAQGDPDESLLLAGWTGWVWGTWRDRWEKLLKPDWTFEYEHGGWDWRIIRHWCGEQGMATAVPALSLSQHIGKLGGMHTNPATWSHHLSRCFAPDYGPQRYRRRQPDVPLALACHHTGT